jgi:endonuclease/exonuclease/phosphatase family metal-dependent hydrolase
MKLASFNVENLFERARALNLTTWSKGKGVLAAYERFNRVSQAAAYSAQDKKNMLADLKTLGILRVDKSGNLVLVRNNKAPWASLLENHGALLAKPNKASVTIKAAGRGNWIGWVSLVPEPVNDKAIQFTAQVIDDVGADVLCVVEAEHRPALVRFNREMLKRPYVHAMLIDGNDPRGIDVGLLAKDTFPIVQMHSHVDDPDPAGPAGKALFSRDCPVYRMRTPLGNDLWLVLNHLKSQSWTSGDPDPLRRRQADRVLAIYNELVQAGAQYVAMLGDFNKAAPPKYPSLEPLLGPASPLVDSTKHPKFDNGGLEGTFQSCGLDDRLDYILLSPPLAAKQLGGGIFRKGLWGDPSNKNPPKRWQAYPDITKAIEAASDHAAIWVELNV